MAVISYQEFLPGVMDPGLRRGDRVIVNVAPLRTFRLAKSFKLPKKYSLKRAAGAAVARGNDGAMICMRNRRRRPFRRMAG